MKAILSHGDVRVQLDQEQGVVMVSLPGANPRLFNSFETHLDYLDTLIGLLRTARSIATPRTFEAELAGPDNIVPIMARKQVD